MTALGKPTMCTAADIMRDQPIMRSADVGYPIDPPSDSQLGVQHHGGQAAGG